MHIDTRQNKQPSLDKLRDQIAQKWPEALCRPSDMSRLVFDTGLPQLDALFPLNGIPYGQLIEITGDVSSGKLSLLFQMLAYWSKSKTAAYIDFSGTFFPQAAASSGIDLNNLLIVRPDRHHDSDLLRAGLRTAEILLTEQAAHVIVLDLTDQRIPLPLNLMHRLRLKTLRAKATVIFLTDNKTQCFPPSMVSLRLRIDYKSESTRMVSVIYSRISPEGMTTEVRRHEH